MKTTLFFLSSVMLTLLSTSCSSVKVVTDIDKTVDFTKFNTYSFLGWEKNSDASLSEFDKKRIKDSFRTELKARGLNYVEENGDMEISLFIVVDQKKQ